MEILDNLNRAIVFVSTKEYSGTKLLHEENKLFAKFLQNMYGTKFRIIIKQNMTFTRNLMENATNFYAIHGFICVFAIKLSDNISSLLNEIYAKISQQIANIIQECKTYHNNVNTLFVIVPLENKSKVTPCKPFKNAHTKIVVLGSPIIQYISKIQSKNVEKNKLLKALDEFFISLNRNIFHYYETVLYAITHIKEKRDNARSIQIKVLQNILPNFVTNPAQANSTNLYGKCNLKNEIHLNISQIVTWLDNKFSNGEIINNGVVGKLSHSTQQNIIRDDVSNIRLNTDQMLARLEKQAADYCILLGYWAEAETHYQTAMDINKQLGDNLWYAASLEGWCFTIINKYFVQSMHSKDENQNTKENNRRHINKSYSTNDISTTSNQTSTSPLSKKLLNSTYPHSPMNDSSIISNKLNDKKSQLNILVQGLPNLKNHYNTFYRSNLNLGSLFTQQPTSKVSQWSTIKITKQLTLVETRLLEAIKLYKEFPEISDVTFDAMVKTVCFYIIIKEKIKAETMLREAINFKSTITKNPSFECWNLYADLYNRMGMKRKAALYKRSIGLKMINEHDNQCDYNYTEFNSIPMFIGQDYGIPLDPFSQVPADTEHHFNLNYDLDLKCHSGFKVGWPSIQRQILDEMIAIAKHFHHIPLAIRHALFKLEYFAESKTMVNDKKILSSDFGVLQALSYKTTQILGTSTLFIHDMEDKTFAISPIPLLHFPIVRRIEFPSLPNKPIYFGGESFFEPKHTALQNEKSDVSCVDKNTGVFGSFIFDKKYQNIKNFAIIICPLQTIASDLSITCTTPNPGTENPFIFSPFFHKLKSYRDSTTFHTKNFHQRKRFSSLTKTDESSSIELDPIIWIQDEPCPIEFWLKNIYPVDIPLHYMGIVSDSHKFQEIRGINTFFSTKDVNSSTFNNNNNTSSPMLIKAVHNSDINNSNKNSDNLMPNEMKNNGQHLNNRLNISLYDRMVGTPPKFPIKFTNGSGHRKSFSYTPSMLNSTETSIPTQTKISIINNSLLGEKEPFEKFMQWITPQNVGTFEINGYYVDLYPNVRSIIRDKDLRQYSLHKCHRKNLNDILPSFNYKIKVIPPLPLLGFRTPFPTNTFSTSFFDPNQSKSVSEPTQNLSYPLESNIIYCSLYTGQYLDCPITLFNNGKISIEHIKLILSMDHKCHSESSTHYNVTQCYNPEFRKSSLLTWKKMVQSNSSNGQKGQPCVNLPIGLGAHREIFVTLYGTSKFFWSTLTNTNSLCSTEESDIGKNPANKKLSIPKNKFVALTSNLFGKNSEKEEPCIPPKWTSTPYSIVNNENIYNKISNNITNNTDSITNKTPFQSPRLSSSPYFTAPPNFENKNCLNSIIKPNNNSLKFNNDYISNSSSPSAIKHKFITYPVYNPCLSINYASDLKASQGYGRKLEIAFHIEIKPSIIVTGCQLLDAESPNLTYLVLDLMNKDPLKHEIQVIYAENKEIHLSYEGISKIAISCQKVFIFPKQLESFIKHMPHPYFDGKDSAFITKLSKEWSYQLYGKKLSTHQWKTISKIINYHLNQECKLVWKIMVNGRVETHGNLHLYDLEWSQNQLMSKLVVSHLTWDLNVQNKNNNVNAENIATINLHTNLKLLITITNYADLDIDGIDVLLFCKAIDEPNIYTIYHYTETNPQYTKVENGHIPFLNNKILANSKLDIWVLLNFDFPALYSIELLCNPTNLSFKPWSDQCNLSEYFFPIDWDYKKSLQICVSSS